VKSKRVTRFNLQDVLPAEFDAAKGIIDNDAFITNLQAWAMNDQVNPDRNKGCDCDAASSIKSVAGEDGLQYGQSQQSVSAVSSKDRSFGAEEFDIRHSVSPSNSLAFMCEELHV
jgi:hypothetical protein